jgi:hypothetical protein
MIRAQVRPQSQGQEKELKPRLKPIPEEKVKAAAAVPWRKGLMCICEKNHSSSAWLKLIYLFSIC